MLKAIRSHYLAYLGFITAIAMSFAGVAAASDVEGAQLRWDSANLTNYQFTLTQRVMWGATSIVLIQVRAGKLVAADHIIKRTNPVPDHPANDGSGLRKTIDALFQDITSRADFVEATFDAELGYPVNVYYRNPDFEEAVDQLEIRDFMELTDEV